MSGFIKLSDVSQQMYLEPAEEVGMVGRTPKQPLPCGLPEPSKPSQFAKKQQSLGVYDAKVSGGKSVRLLKTMLTTACERNCNYCPFRAGRNYKRTTFKPEEMAKTFIQLADSGVAEGIFLSSGIIKGGVTTQDKLLDTVDIIRNRYNYRGYIHLKVMPGAERDQVARAMQIADRISVNLEAPTIESLNFLAPMKQLVEELSLIHI